VALIGRKSHIVTVQNLSVCVHMAWRYGMMPSCYENALKIRLVLLSISNCDYCQFYSAVYWLHACITSPMIHYGSATVSDSLNGCCRPICSVFGTAALRDALVRSAV